MFEHIEPGPRSWFRYRGRLWTGSTGVMIRHGSVVPPVIMGPMGCGWMPLTPRPWVDGLLDAWDSKPWLFTDDHRAYPVEYFSLMGQGRVVVHGDSLDGAALVVRNKQPLVVIFLPQIVEMIDWNKERAGLLS